jgi:hypothetical protein
MDSVLEKKGKLDTDKDGYTRIKKKVGNRLRRGERLKAKGVKRMAQG